MATVFDVADYILAEQGAMATMKLQKLVYYCQGWHLAWDGEPLFDERIEAWASGPVVPALHAALRGVYRVDRALLAEKLADAEVVARVNAQLAAEGLPALGQATRPEPGRQPARRRLWMARAARATAAAGVMTGVAAAVLGAATLLRRRP